MKKIDYEKMQDDMRAILKRIEIIDAELNSIQQIASIYIIQLDELIDSGEEGNGNVH